MANPLNQEKIKKLRTQTGLQKLTYTTIMDPTVNNDSHEAGVVKQEDPKRPTKRKRCVFQRIRIKKMYKKTKIIHLSEVEDKQPAEADRS